MTTVIETDVLIIGAGPTGLVAANLLADMNVRVMLVERNPDISDEPRAISITDESLRVMQRIGVMERLAPELLMDTGARYFGRKGQLLAQVQAPKARLGHPAKSQFDQPVLAALLLDAARSRPLVDLRFSTEAFGLASNADGVDAVLVDDGGRLKVRAKWVIACDGGRSPVRSQLGIPLEGSTQVQKWIVVDAVNVPGEPEKFADFFCNGKRPSVMVPGVKGRRRYELMLLPGEDAKAVTTPESIVAMISPYQLISKEDIRRAAVYVAQQRVALAFKVGRIMLAGDAAHLMPPFAGQGLNSGIRDVANLAWKVAAHIHGQGTDALVNTYEPERRPHVVDMVRLSHRIGLVVMATSRWQVLARDFVLKALGVIPSVKRWIVEMRFVKQPQVISGCIVPSDYDETEAAASLIGRSLSQPTVFVDGVATPLDSLLGPGWCLLRFPPGSQIEIVPLELNGLSLSSATLKVKYDGQAFASVMDSDATLWVRPDRYVAAICNRDKEMLVAHELRRYVPRLPEVVEAKQCTPPVQDGTLATV